MNLKKMFDPVFGKTLKQATVVWYDRIDLTGTLRTEDGVLFNFSALDLRNKDDRYLTPGIHVSYRLAEPFLTRPVQIEVVGQS